MTTKETPSSGDITRLLRAAQRGEPGAESRLFTLLYRDLRLTARRQLRRHDHRRALNTTLLVNESYLRLRDRSHLQSADRGQFLAYAAAAMRSVIVDLARQRLAQKRGGIDPNITLVTEIADTVANGDLEVVHVHEALGELAAVQPRLARIVELRFFGGLDELEVAQTLGISRRTVQREWEKARVFLFAAMKSA